MISTAVGGPCTTMELVMLSATRRVRPIRREAGAVLTSGAESALPREPEEPPPLPPNEPLPPLKPPPLNRLLLPCCERLFCVFCVFDLPLPVD